MPKTLMSFLFISGIFLLLVGIVFGKYPATIGLVMIVIALIGALNPDSILRAEHVEDSWSMLISKAQGKSEYVFQTVDTNVKENNISFITMERKAIAAGSVSGYLGNTRDFLVVTDNQNMRLSPYKIFINARDYGDNLDVSWYLTFKPGIWQAILSLIPFINVIQKTLAECDLFDQQDLRAYATVVHHSVIKSVEQLMQSLNQDPSKIERKSRGFLGIS